MDTGREEAKSVDRLLDEIRELRGKKEYYQNILETANKGVLVIDNSQKIAFSRIVENSIEYSDPKVLKIRVTSTADRNSSHLCRITFEDSGPGIPDGLKRILTGRLWDQKGITIRRVLGLQFVMTIIEDYKGKVWIEDRVKGNYRKGVKFVMVLPAAER